eukprot:TRINITY_DN15052_c0_g2_i9.p1 TRINITY_DN15052_c0_g2~~TRINITY_DN15052_c0_g2_i9.p1  ORF type:complete len:136 (+),score=1.98 TRINITY_DN15052_c0_g2_i9:2571-2978(+)
MSSWFVPNTVSHLGPMTDQQFMLLLFDPIMVKDSTKGFLLHIFLVFCFHKCIFNRLPTLVKTDSWHFFRHDLAVYKCGDLVAYEFFQVGHWTVAMFRLGLTFQCPSYNDTWYLLMFIISYAHNVHELIYISSFMF